VFPEPPRTPVRLSNHFMLLRGGDVAYQAYTGRTRVQCDECVWVLHEAHGVGEPPRSARIKRCVVKKETSSIMFLCHAHSELWHTVDGK
jgi:hypothetical protein